jgi:broad specificity phosphatase PhoE
MELERIERPILVICHQAITRVLLAFFQEVDPSKIPYTEVPLHTLIEIQPSAYRLQLKQYKLLD